MNIRQIVPLSCTVGAMLAGFGSMLASAAGHYVQGAQLIMLSMILDGLDGTLARRLKATSAFGAELDTFVDFSSFGLAPAFLAWQAVLHRFGVWGFVIASAVIVSGASRLSRFRLVDPFRGQKGYLGLPITVNAGWISLAVFVANSGVLEEEWFTLQAGPLAAFIWGVAIILCGLEVSHVRYDKPTKDPIVQIVCIPLTVLLFANNVHIASLSAITMLAYGFIFAFISPLTHHRRHAMVVAEEDEEEQSVPLNR